MSAMDRLAEGITGRCVSEGTALWCLTHSGYMTPKGTGCNVMADRADDAERILDALPALLREDSPDGDELRAKLGLSWDRTQFTGQYGIHTKWRRLVAEWEPL